MTPAQEAEITAQMNEQQKRQWNIYSINKLQDNPYKKRTPPKEVNEKEGE